MAQEIYEQVNGKEMGQEVNEGVRGNAEVEQLELVSLGPVKFLMKPKHAKIFRRTISIGAAAAVVGGLYYVEKRGYAKGVARQIPVLEAKDKEIERLKAIAERPIIPASAPVMETVEDVQTIDAVDDSIEVGEF